MIIIINKKMVGQEGRSLQTRLYYLQVKCYEYVYKINYYVAVISAEIANVNNIYPSCYSRRARLLGGNEICLPRYG